MSDATKRGRGQHPRPAPVPTVALTVRVDPEIAARFRSMAVVLEISQGELLGNLVTSLSDVLESVQSAEDTP